ncbi:MAG: VTT domain-containing protein [Kofleriaceae bacterium]|nr:VTT domain-containing protein [Myxococcales bacterium]MCB9561005.1 VTT domain-containing protein [Kofleriaceae bacterium]MCB9574511.1 VTT domain-containing protein [Kofleriaceae bacterium]
MWRLPSLRRLRALKLTHRWRAFFYALTAFAVVGGATMLIWPALSGVFLLAAYCIPANSVVPIPHEPAVLYFAKYYDPAWIAVAGTVGSVVVSFSDYALVEAAMGHPRVKNASEARLFRWAVRWMTRWPFAIIVLFSLIPVFPIAVVRVLAPASRYPLRRYIAAQIVGRLPRFYLLAWFGKAVMVPTWLILVLTVVMIAVFWLGGRPVAATIEDEPDAEEIEVPDLSDPEHPVAAGSSTQLPVQTG